MSQKLVPADLSSGEWTAVKRVLKNFVFFNCQNSQCDKTVCRRIKSDGTLVIKNHFCSPQCNNDVVGRSKSTGKHIQCENGCGTEIYRKECHLKSRRHITCSNKCWHDLRGKIHRNKKEKEETREASERTSRINSERESQECRRQEEREKALRIGHQHRCTQCRRSPWTCHKDGCTGNDMYSVCEACMKKLEPVET
jgi:hypothetical protein